MAHYALLDENNVVTSVFVGVDETENIDGKTPEDYYSELFSAVCKRTSYNGNIRKNFAGPGMLYDETRDAFLAEQPYPSWTLNEENCHWEPPVAAPAPIDGELYAWDEPSLSWVLTGKMEGVIQ